MLIASADHPVSTAVAELAAASGREVTHLEPSELTFERLFREKRERGELVVVAIEPLARIAREPATLWTRRHAEIASAVGVSKWVLVSSRPQGDELFAAVRRTGVPYDIVRVPHLVEIDTEAVARLAARPRAAVAPALLQSVGDAANLADVAAAILACIERPSAGSERVVERDGGAALLERLQHLGVEVATSRTRRAWWRLLGRPALLIDSGGRISIPGRAPPRALAHPQPAPL